MDSMGLTRYMSVLMDDAMKQARTQKFPLKLTYMPE